MHKLTSLISALVMLFCVTDMFAQGITVTGRVVDETGEPLIAVTVFEEGKTSNGVDGAADMPRSEFTFLLNELLLNPSLVSISFTVKSGFAMFSMIRESNFSRNTSSLSTILTARSTRFCLNCTA